MGFLSKIDGDFGNFYVDFFCKIEGEFNFLVNFFFDFPCKFTPALVLHVLYRSRVLSRPRYRPPTPVLVVSEVRGTTLQKLIVDSEVREYDSSKLSSLARYEVRLFKVNCE